jgi:hypothetical protein
MRLSMVEVFYKTKLVEEQSNVRTEYITLVLAPVPPASFVVIEVHGKWDMTLNETRCQTKVVSSQDSEGDAIREYDKYRATLETKGFVTVVPAGELRLVPPVSTTVKAKRRDAVRVFG